jgi:hypothetical protein
MPKECHSERSEEPKNLSRLGRIDAVTVNERGMIAKASPLAVCPQMA